MYNCKRKGARLSRDKKGRKFSCQERGFHLAAKEVLTTQPRTRNRGMKDKVMEQQSKEEMRSKVDATELHSSSLGSQPFPLFLGVHYAVQFLF
ncbi:hypothetical protein O6P43_005999 [Quillaja saponaria]|uniref:Uncharacterized protein n=1 Tax=Quillaja saponaria TaxID=32244 RepID=A0AAD7Q7B4_QUISA|nr:hypothetical protein O6P43_005999 [Quillaja saponaria]